MMEEEAEEEAAAEEEAEGGGGRRELGCTLAERLEVTELLKDCFRGGLHRLRTRHRHAPRHVW